MILLLESKRDDLLLPYFEVVKEKIPGLTLGKFKGIMLDKLAAQGNINNLSLGSNFYLAGATRYYFEGQLTTNGVANIANGDMQTPDAWDNETCKKLNAVINILRNSYIDSVGTKFEIEEDFGKLPIAKLFRKYGKKINAELGIDAQDDKPKTPELDRDPHVGNGYTFDILYSYNDATKYNVYTSPGAWCITYGMQHYNYYRERLGIHYVIFLKDGYQNVERKTGPGYTRYKPHDEYGNSMIAFLQKNDSWYPTYITSRWNHGHGDTSGTEADHAYTLEEFCNITGVTPEDLQRIYKIWKTDNRNRKEVTYDRTEIKAGTVEVTRKLKYAQMVINNGQRIEDALSEAGATLKGTIYGSGEAKKSVNEYRIKGGEFTFAFICDRTNIVFESLYEAGSISFDCAADLWIKEGSNVGSDIIIFKYENYSKIYSIRYHSLVDIGGQTKFKRLPDSTRMPHYATPLFIEVKNSFKDVALLSLASGKPLKLPNGQYWFNEVIADYKNRRWHPRNQIISDIIYDCDVAPIIEIIYDESSREKYFYSLKSKKFVDLDGLTNDEYVQSYSRNAIQDPNNYELRIANGLGGMKNYCAVGFTPDTSYYHMTSSTLLDANGNKVSIYGKEKFRELKGYLNRLLIFNAGDRDSGYYTDKQFYDVKTKKLLAIGETAVKGYDISHSGRYDASYEEAPRYLFIQQNGKRDKLLYDTQVGLFAKNPLTGQEYFKIEDDGDYNGKGTALMKDNFDYWEFINTLHGMDYDNRYDLARKEKEKHMLFLDSIQLEYYPNNMPVNNEYEKQQAASAEPAYSLTEEKIREAVSNAIKKIMK